MDKRTGGGHFGVGAERRRTGVKNWNEPVRWNAKHAEFYALHGRRQRVFCASMADVFDNAVDPQWRADLFELIRSTPNLDWQILTKRIGNVSKMVDEVQRLLAGVGVSLPWPLANVWLGVTIVNQVEAVRDIPKLLAVPACKRFLSMEPLLGAVDLIGLLEGIDWVIVGGESGSGARPMHPAWVRGLRDQCATARVPFFFKQWGEWAVHRCLPGGDEGGDVRRGRVVYLVGDGREPDGHFRKGDAAVARVGLKAAGRVLDGVLHDGFPG